jgi:predicted MFS family arabinose efflux permease
LLLPGIGNKSMSAVSWRTMTKLAYLAKVVLIVFYKRHDKLRLMAIVVYLCRSSCGIGVLGLMTYQERADDDNDSSSSAVLSVCNIAINRGYQFEHFAL